MLYDTLSTFRTILYLKVVDQLCRNTSVTLRTIVCPTLLNKPPWSLMRSIVCNLFLQIVCLCVNYFLYSRFRLLMNTVLYPDSRYLNQIDYGIQYVPVFNIFTHHKIRPVDRLLNLQLPSFSQIIESWNALAQLRCKR